MWIVCAVGYFQMAETQFAWLTHMIIKWALFVLRMNRVSFNWSIRANWCLLYRFLCYDVWNTRIFLEIESDAIVVKFNRVLTLTFQCEIFRNAILSESICVHHRTLAMRMIRTFPISIDYIEWNLLFVLVQLKWQSILMERKITESPNVHQAKQPN